LLGAMVVRGHAPRLRVRQYSATKREYSGSLGVAAHPALDAFPRSYDGATHVHLATMPPQEQMAWYSRCRALSNAKISVDMFEKWAFEEDALCRQLCYSADLVFMNSQELRFLFSGNPLPTCDLVIKDGPNGAWLRNRGAWRHVPAPLANLVDSTGAGEILAGCFLSLFSLGFPARQCLSYSVRAASAKVSEFGFNGSGLLGTIAQIHSDVVEALAS
jgi:sugar/nucleoside kinase (ribokinase family)